VNAGRAQHLVMNEWLLLLYPPAVFAYLMLASRLQPKGPDAPAP
jgi:hypothetical protein